MIVYPLCTSCDFGSTYDIEALKSFLCAFLLLYIWGVSWLTLATSFEIFIVCHLLNVFYSLYNRIEGDFNFFWEKWGFCWVVLVNKEPKIIWFYCQERVCYLWWKKSSKAQIVVFVIVYDKLHNFYMTLDVYLYINLHYLCFSSLSFTFSDFMKTFLTGAFSLYLLQSHEDPLDKGLPQIRSY